MEAPGTDTVDCAIGTAVGDVMQDEWRCGGKRLLSRWMLNNRPVGAVG